MMSPLAPDDRWYQRAVFYEVLIRGFSDSTGDGTDGTANTWEGNHPRVTKPGGPKKK